MDTGTTTIEEGRGDGEEKGRRGLREDGEVIFPEGEVGKSAANDSSSLGWQPAKDPATGRTYYYHWGTGETTWERPPGNFQDFDNITNETARKETAKASNSSSHDVPRRRRRARGSHSRSPMRRTERRRRRSSCSRDRDISRSRDRSRSRDLSRSRDRDISRSRRRKRRNRSPRYQRRRRERSDSRGHSRSPRRSTRRDLKRETKTDRCREGASDRNRGREETRRIGQEGKKQRSRLVGAALDGALGRSGIGGSYARTHPAGRYAAMAHRARAIINIDMHNDSLKPEDVPLPEPLQRKKKKSKASANKDNPQPDSKPPETPEQRAAREKELLEVKARAEQMSKQWKEMQRQKQQRKNQAIKGQTGVASMLSRLKKSNKPLPRVTPLKPTAVPTVPLAPKPTISKKTSKSPSLSQNSAPSSAKPKSTSATQDPQFAKGDMVLYKGILSRIEAVHYNSESYTLECGEGRNPNVPFGSPNLKQIKRKNKLGPSTHEYTPRNVKVSNIPSSVSKRVFTNAPGTSHLDQLGPTPLRKPSR